MSDELIVGLIEQLDKVSQQVSELQQQANTRDELLSTLIDRFAEVVNRPGQILVKEDGSADIHNTFMGELRRLEGRINDALDSTADYHAFKAQHLLDHERNGGDQRNLSPFEIDKKISQMHQAAASLTKKS